MLIHLPFTTDPCRMFVHVPANIFWIEPSALERYWNYNLDVEDEESPAEPGEPQPLGEEGVERALQVFVDLFGIFLKRTLNIEFDRLMNRH